MICDSFKEIGEYGAAGMYEDCNRSLFYRKSLGIRRYYENAELYPYNGEYLYPSGTKKPSMNIYPHYWHGMDIQYGALDKDASGKILNEELYNRFCSDFNKFKSTVPAEHAVAGNMFTHSIPNYERILQEGLLSYTERILKIEDRDIRDGLIHLIEGIKAYTTRCVNYLKSISADKKLIDALEQVPLKPARNIYEALVSWNFVMYLDNCDNLGCLDRGLYQYYRGENIVDILKNLFDNLDSNGGYSMSLGGEYSKITIACLEASKGKRRPMIELFVNDDTPDYIWEKAFEVIRSSNGQPAFYNEKEIFAGLRKRFSCISEEDIKKFCGGGCTESMLAGLSCVGSLDAGINLLKILEDTMKSHLEKSNSFQKFYDCYISNVRSVVDMVTMEISNSQKERAQYCPLPMRTLLIDDCIDNGKDYYNGGARYKWSIVNFAGTINVIDSLLVIRDYIFVDKKLSANEFLRLLKENDSSFLAEVRKHPVSYGCDNDDVNRFADKLSADIFPMLDNKKPYLGEGFIPASIQFMSQVDAGKGIGATPDGRENGAPLCDSLAAIFGKDTNGPTALLNSVTSLNLHYMLGIPVLNFNIEQDFKNDVLKALIKGYMNLGGLQMQITCASKEELLDAYKNPDMHRNLVVRVGGYSEYFCNLSDGLKRMVIDRTIQKQTV